MDGVEGKIFILKYFSLSRGMSGEGLQAEQCSVELQAFGRLVCVHCSSKGEDMGTTVSTTQFYGPGHQCPNSEPLYHSTLAGFHLNST